MGGTILVFVNGSGLKLPASADVAAAIAAYDPSLMSSIGKGAAYVTDGRGIELELGGRLASGAILRVIVRARRGADADA
jgi:hypothetical protein